jgi:hypothetical protein
MKYRIIGGYNIFIGVSVIALWITILNGTELPEGKTELVFHLLSEFLMAIICIVSGVKLFYNKSGGKTLGIFGLGMVIYSVMNAAGYYGEKGESEMVIMFIVLAVTSVIAFILLVLNDFRK